MALPGASTPNHNYGDSLLNALNSPHLILIPRAMPNAEDDHRVSLHSIPQHIGPYRRHLAPAFARVAPALGKLGKAVRHCDQPLAQLARRRRIECRNVGNDRLEVLDRLVGPDDLA